MGESLIQYTHSPDPCTEMSTTLDRRPVPLRFNQVRCAARLLLYYPAVKRQKTLATTALLLILAPGVARADDFDRSLKLVESGDYVGGQKILKKLVRLHPERPEVWFNLGYTLYKEKSFDAAIEAWETVIKLKSPLAQTAELYHCPSAHGL